MGTITQALARLSVVVCERRLIACIGADVTGLAIGSPQRGCDSIMNQFASHEARIFKSNLNEFFFLCLPISMSIGNALAGDCMSPSIVPTPSIGERPRSHVSRLPSTVGNVDHPADVQAATRCSSMMWRLSRADGAPLIDLALARAPGQSSAKVAYLFGAHRRPASARLGKGSWKQTRGEVLW